MSDCHRLVYLSRNELADEPDPDAEVRRILTVSRRDNAAVGVTGSLMFNAGVFAQVLEGPLMRIEPLFERIQCDPRHSSVRIMQFERVSERLFADWAMAWAGSGAAPLPEFGAGGGDVERLETSGDRVLQLLVSHLACGEAAPDRRRSA